VAHDSSRAEVQIAIQILPEGQGLELPAYMTPGAAGMDVRAAVEDELVLQPGECSLIPAGFRMAVPPGYEAQIRPRSGLALKHGVTVMNAPGTIDADYRGPVGVLLANLGAEAFVVRRGDRIAQMVIAPVCRARLVVTESLPETARGAGGFGHTGT
jgi:dUTP pyrophosphatase